VRKSEGAWQANFRIPPGTPRGWQQVRLRLASSGWSNALRIAYDVPVAVDGLRVTGAADSESWTPGETQGKLSCWVEGLPENADRGNVKVWVGDYRARVVWVGSGQVNATVECPAGEYGLRVECGGVVADGGSVRARERLA
jgi:hypothetical protein